MSTGDEEYEGAGTPGSVSGVSVSRACRRRHSGQSVGHTFSRHMEHTRSHCSCAAAGSASKMRSTVSGGSVSNRLGSPPRPLPSVVPMVPVVPEGAGGASQVRALCPLRLDKGAARYVEARLSTGVCALG